MPCGRCIENDVFVGVCQSRIGQKGCKLVECGDLRSAGTRELLFDTLHDCFGQHATHRTDNSLPIVLSCCLRVDFERKKITRRGLHGRNSITDMHAEHLPHV